MRNVTIVESNVEPNKEHLWFYNGRLKWFGPNGWEEIYSQALSPTTTPKPVVPPATTTTSTAPGPGVATTPIGMRVYNYMDATIDTIVFGANSVNRYIPANGDIYIEGVYPSTSGGNITLYIKARGSGSTSSGAQVNRFLDVNIMGEISGTSIQQFKSILNEGTIDIPYTGSDALHSISLVVSISDGDTTTTTSSPIPGSNVRFTNNTNTDIQIYGVLYNGDTASPPMQPGQTYILRYISDGVAVYNSPNYSPFDSLKITAFRGKVQEDVPYIIDTDAISNGVMYKFPEGLSWVEITEISIEGSIQGTGTTSSTPTPNSTKFTNNTDASLILYRYNDVDGALDSPPIQPGQHYILVHNNNDAETDSYIELRTASESDILLPFSSLKITAFNYEGQEFDVPYEHNQDAMGQHLYRVSFKELIEKGATTVSINGSISTPTTTTTTTTTSSSTPAPITEQEILVSNDFIGEDGPTFGITMDDNINFNNVVPSRLESLEPYREGIYVTYTPSSRYLAVVSPKTNGFKDTIVATILVPVDGSFEYESHTLYPINSMDNESSKYFLFDLSKSPYVGTAAYSNPCVELHNYNSHSISSIPPFIDGNIPPFADEE
nr:MAG TPA: hypothetical protein [Crassvirales sp.]